MKKKLLLVCLVFLVSLGIVFSFGFNEPTDASASEYQIVSAVNTTYNDNKGYKTGHEESSDIDMNNTYSLYTKTENQVNNDSMPTFSGDVTVKFSIKVDTDHKLQENKYEIKSDSSKKVDLSCMGESSEYNLDGKIGYGIIIIKTPDGKVNKFNPNFFSSGKTDVVFPTFTTDGVYHIALFFESQKAVTFGKYQNHKVYYTFEIIRTNDSYGTLNTMRVLNRADNGATDIHKNGVAPMGGIFNFNEVSKLTVECTYTYDGKSNNFKGYDGYTFDENGKIFVCVYRGPFFLESFYIIIDNVAPRGTFSNIKDVLDDDTVVAESYSDFSWDLGAGLVAPKVCKVYDRDTLRLVAQDYSGTLRINEGNYKVVLEYDDEYYVKSTSYYLQVLPSLKPTDNYDKLNANRFNNTKTKWYDVQNFSSGEIMSFYDYDIAFKFAMAVEDVIVKNESSFLNNYVNKYSKLYDIYYALSGDFVSKLSAIRNDTDTNIYLTSLMNDYAQKNTKLTYFKLNDTTERSFDNVSMFDKSKMWLNDDFEFVTSGEWDSSRIELHNLESGELINMPYNTPIKNTGLSGGRYEVTEEDIYGNQNVYTVYRDKQAPEVSISLNKEASQKANNNASYNCSYFSVSQFADNFDEWSVLKINDDYYLKGDCPVQYYKSGKYNISAYDRNANEMSFTIVVANRDLQVNISGDNNEKNYVIMQNDCLTLKNFAINISGSYLDVFYDFEINGDKKTASQINNIEVKEFGNYKYKIADKFSGQSLQFSVIIENRELKSEILYDDNKTQRAVNGAVYNVNKFLISAADYILIGCDKNIDFTNDYITQVGVYKFTAQDKFNGEKISFTVIIDKKEIAAILDIDDGERVKIDNDGEITVKRFKLEYSNLAQRDYMAIYINDSLYSLENQYITAVNKYTITLINKYNSERLEYTVNIEPRSKEILIAVNNNEDTLSLLDSNIEVLNFEILSVPKHLDVSINNKLISSEQINKLMCDFGTYNFIITDRYNNESVQFSLTIVNRKLEADITFDSDITEKISKNEYFVRRFKIGQISDFAQLTINGNPYLFTSYVMTAGTYQLEITDIYNKNQKIISTIIVEDDAADVNIIYDDNKVLKAEDLSDYEFYRFKLKSISAEVLMYTEITLNGKPYNFDNGFYLSVGTYNFIVTDLYYNKDFTFTVTINDRMSSVIINDSDGELNLKANERKEVYSFTLDCLEAYTKITVNAGVQNFQNGAIKFSGFGEYKIVVEDKYNGYIVSYTLIIKERKLSPSIYVDSGSNLEVQDKETYSVYRFKIDKMAHQNVLVAGVNYENSLEYITAPKSYVITVTDKYSGEVLSFTLIVKETDTQLKLFIDYNKSVEITDSCVKDVKRFYLKTLEDTQSEYLKVTINDVEYNFNNKYTTAFGEHEIVIENIYTGERICFTLNIAVRSLALNIVYDNNVLASLTSGTYNFLRFKISDQSDLLGYADIKYSDGTISYSEFISSFGSYNFTITDKFSGKKEIIVINVQPISVKFETGVANKSIVNGDTSIILGYENMDIVIKKDGREIDLFSVLNGNQIMLTNNGTNETHYYIALKSKYNKLDTLEIYLIVTNEA